MRLSKSTKFLKIQLIQPKLEPNNKINFNKSFTFISGCLLAISESLPFFDTVKSNGLLDMFSNILKEYKENFRN